MQSNTASDNVHYTVFIRLPFPRGDFVDPPLVDWNSSNDRELWSMISQNPKSNDLNWQDIADQFNVPVPFLLKQAAWLYEQQLADVRAQMRRIGNSRPTSIVRGHEISLGIQAQGRSGSLSGNNTIGVASTSGSGSGTSMTVRGSRSGQGRGSFRELAFNLGSVRSGLNAVESPVDQASTQPSSAIATPRPAFLQLGPPAQSFQARPPPFASITSESVVSGHDDNDDGDDDADDDEEDDDDVEDDRHRTLRRSSLFRPTRILSPSEHSGNSSPRFLPFLAGIDDVSEKSGDTADEDHDDEGGSSHQQDQPTTGRQVASRPPELGHTLRGTQRRQPSDNMASQSETTPAAGLAISPRTASSISDLDDTSLTQSALEEALASHLRKGGASRISAFGP